VSTINQYDFCIGETLGYIRKQKKIRQAYVSDSLFMSRSNYSDFETGKRELPEELYQAVKRILGVEELPLRKSERPKYMSLLNDMYRLTSEGKFEAASEMHERLSVIKLLPQDKELNEMFSLHECWFFLKFDKFDEAKKILDAFSPNYKGLNHIPLYHYLYNQGVYNFKINLIDDALDSFLQAYDLTDYGLEKSGSLCFNIALCYERKGFISKSNDFINKALDLGLASNNTVLEFGLYTIMGTNSIVKRALPEARGALNKAHSIASKEYESNPNENTKRKFGISLLNHGYLFRISKKHYNAIKALDKSTEYLKKDDNLYFEAFYQKACCAIDMNDPLLAIEIISEGVKLSKGNKDYSLMFEALSIMTNPTEESIEHLSQHILPYFIKKNYVVIVIDYATYLRKYYREHKIGNIKRALEMSEVIFIAQSRINEGGVIECEDDLSVLY